MSEHWGEEEFLLYFDARLDAEARTRLEAHLAACADCRQQLEETRALRGVLAEWRPVAASADFDARLWARLERERQAEGERQRKGWFLLRPAYAAAFALAILLAVGVSLWPPAPPLPSPAPVAVQEPPASSTDAEDVAVVDNPVLLENYELLEEFDVLFEPLEKEEGKSL